MPKAPHYPVPALEKGLDVLETLAAAAVPQSLAELAATLKRSRHELFRMLNCLERRGYLTRDPLSGKYGLTLKLYTLAHAHSVVEKLLHAATAPMQAFTERMRESCHLSVLEDGKLLVIAQQESPERVRISIEVGGEFEAVSTASGRLLLAQLDAAARTVALDGTPGGRALTGRALTDLLDRLQEIRRRRVSTAESETIEGVRDTAVLVGDPAVGVTAALAVTRLIKRGQRGDEAALIAAMHETAAAITHTLGLEVAA